MPKARSESSETSVLKKPDASVFLRSVSSRVSTQKVVRAKQRVDGRRLLPVHDRVGLRSADAHVALGVETARGLKNVDAHHQVGLAVRNDGRDRPRG